MLLGTIVTFVQFHGDALVESFPAATVTKQSHMRWDTISDVLCT